MLFSVRSWYTLYLQNLNQNVQNSIQYFKWGKNPMWSPKKSSQLSFLSQQEIWCTTEHSQQSSQKCRLNYLYRVKLVTITNLCIIQQVVNGCGSINFCCSWDKVIAITASQIYWPLDWRGTVAMSSLLLYCSGRENIWPQLEMKRGIVLMTVGFTALWTIHIFQVFVCFTFNRNYCFLALRDKFMALDLWLLLVQCNIHLNKLLNPVKMQNFNIVWDGQFYTFDRSDEYDDLLHTGKVFSSFFWNS